jgi:hypothetical protein
MILEPLQKRDFSIARDIRVNVENRGFTQDDMKKLAGADPNEQTGARGERSWWPRMWLADRQVPPERRALKSEFGYQSNPLLTDLVAVADAQGTTLDGIIKAKTANYNFFIMRCGVYIVPDGGEKFEALKFEVLYEEDKGASTYTMLPGAKTKEILKLGGKAEVGVDSKVAFGVPDVSLATASVDASARAKLEAKFIVAFDYELKAPVVDSLGAGTRFCRWLMHKGDDLRNDVVFYPIIMTPKSVSRFDCEFKAYFKISHPDWTNAELYENPPRTIVVST